MLFSESELLKRNYRNKKVHITITIFPQIVEKYGTPHGMVCVWISKQHSKPTVTKTSHLHSSVVQRVINQIPSCLAWLILPFTRSAISGHTMSVRAFNLSCMNKKKKAHSGVIWEVILHRRNVLEHFSHVIFLPCFQKPSSLTHVCWWFYLHSGDLKEARDACGFTKRWISVWISKTCLVVSV